MMAGGLHPDVEKMEDLLDAMAMKMGDGSRCQAKGHNRQHA